MTSLRLIALLLDYPEKEVWDNAQELNNLIKQCAELSEYHKELINQFIEQMTQTPLMDLQAQYGDLFERGRSLSLLLFEHVHGESRDRGQAMIDLLNQYNAAGMELTAKQLPDYLPTYLEYLSQLTVYESIDGLKDIASILALLKERLSQRQSFYSNLLQVLVEQSGEAIAQERLAETVANEAKDDTPQALDAVWEEEQIKFLGDEGCASAQQTLHQRRFAQAVVPQYLDTKALNGV
ncbi:nitrate reductase molybdenum cofactor assembly chaperone [Shewanella bicestrii]|uniref:Nitrate reductase molybdenum cofactor assembly chaperone n=2 Tax=Shewanella bicestrii TaxID=2018305 RepID=A0A220UST5_9GAMM|nr:nitrate reductase molybdenum cofactor assembly chaperone [Shewanella bicestrii]